ncbi:uncharacterized protein LOC105182486 [Harpegnathos saltator]|uniref:uncharacterized protein LOC105182486 n=1 Tax=Harpegnathos saltator TaxID=610380 RepID=UPI000DBEE070|nr:uncharacterized protein LOC105182486 [Harpegnathos saltator]
MSTRRHVVEKYYDCLQCAEQCRHADLSNPSEMNNSGSGGGNNNNSISASASTSKNSGGGVVVGRIRSGRRLPTTNVSLYGKDVSSPPLDDAKKTRNGRSSLSKSLSRHQSAHLTPVKKRSSLARPVRVHDSFVQPRRLMVAGDEHPQDPVDDRGYHQEQVLRDQASATPSRKNPWWWQEQDQRDQQPNTSSYAYRDAEGRAGEDGADWPIRLRLEQMLELTLPQAKRKKKKKKKKTTATAAAATMMLMKQQQRNRHGFKDTERLLKVLSINNVDQDNRYNIKRCSVM